MGLSQHYSFVEYNFITATGIKGCMVSILLHSRTTEHTGSACDTTGSGFCRWGRLQACQPIYKCRSHHTHVNRAEILMAWQSGFVIYDLVERNNSTKWKECESQACVLTKLTVTEKIHNQTIEYNKKQYQVICNFRLFSSDTVEAQN